MDKTKVYDLPTRIFHWLFAALFLIAFFIAKVMDDEAPVYSYHMLAGLVLAWSVGLRLVWGWTGSKYARFSSFSLNPRSLLRYFTDLISGKTARSLGHNPASSWAALVMMGLAVGMAVSGYLMSTGYKEQLEDVHELMANAFIVVAIAHVAGVILHTLRHKDAIGLSMITGDKMRIEGAAGIERSHAGAALVFVALVGLFVLYLAKNFDAPTQTLKLFGNTLQLGEAEGQDED